MNYKLHLDNLAELDSEAGEISGSWNGDDTSGEDRAHVADEIIGKVHELQELIRFLQAQLNLPPLTLLAAGVLRLVALSSFLRA